MILQKLKQLDIRYISGFISYFQVGQNPPEVGRDPHWDIGIPEELPYTVASLPFRIPDTSTSNMQYGTENLKIPVEQHRRVEASDIDSVMGNQGSQAVRKQQNVVSEYPFGAKNITLMKIGYKIMSFTFRCVK